MKTVPCLCLDMMDLKALVLRSVASRLRPDTPKKLRNRSKDEILEFENLRMKLENLTMKSENLRMKFHP